MLHEKKTLNNYFQDVLEGRKNFEVRMPGDHKVYPGDSLRLVEVDENEEKTGRIIYAEITYVLPVGDIEYLYKILPTCPLEVWGINVMYAMDNGSTIPHGLR